MLGIVVKSIVAAVVLQYVYLSIVTPNRQITRLSDAGTFDVTQWYATAASPRQNATISLVTHVTVDRVPRLQKMCKAWLGPMSVAVFVRPHENTAEVVATLRGDACLKNNADVHVVRRRRTNADESDMFTHYPFNVQRNAALDGVGDAYDWVFLLDVDFVMYPTEVTRERIFAQKFRRTAETLKKHKLDDQLAIYVVPALETVTPDMPHPKDKTELRTALQEVEVCAFYGHYCRGCHNPTQVESFASRNDTYEVFFEEGYEPYVVAARASLPHYDESFIGRGWDKMSFFYELHMQGRRFFVLPDMYLVHSGRGDMPKPEQHTQEYMERQQLNLDLNEKFKKRMERKYRPDLAKARGEVVDDEVPEKVVAAAPTDAGTTPPRTDKEEAKAEVHKEAVLELPIDWRMVSSTRGDETACVAQEREDVAVLQAALSYACSKIDCSPLQSVRSTPAGIEFHADWAFDRYMAFAVAQGEDADQACDFNGAAKKQTCFPGCFKCVVKADADMKAVTDAATWACGHDGGIGDCSPLRRLGLDDRDFAGHVFSYFANVHRCNGQTQEELCDFTGVAEAVAC